MAQSISLSLSLCNQNKITKNRFLILGVKKTLKPLVYPSTDKMGCTAIKQKQTKTKKKKKRFPFH
jgi:hypothetical protein